MIVIVILDATVLLSDVGLRGAAWRVLAQAGPAWEVRVVVPEVVIREAVAGYGRRVTEARAALDGWRRKHGVGLGQIVTDIQARVDTRLADAVASFEVGLRASLAQMRAEIAPLPDVSHAVLVERATARRRPCNEHGDGYRDTLNWFAILDLASKFPREKIAWISDNSKDFGNVQGNGLHEDLIAELDDIHAGNRVIWFRNLQGLVIALAAENSLDETADLHSIQEKLRERLLKDYLSNQLLSSAVGMDLDARSCALPPGAVSARLFLVKEPLNLRLTVRGAAAKGDTVAEFEFESETTIMIELPPGVAPDEPSWKVVQSNTLGSSAAASKLLRYTGLITLDGLGLPTGGGLTRVTAREDDPGRAAWLLADESADLPVLVSGGQKTAEQRDMLLNADAVLSANETSRISFGPALDSQGASSFFSPYSGLSGANGDEVNSNRLLKAILWVDDVPDNVVYEVEELESLGVRVVQATTTKEAVGRQSTDTFDAIISDMGRAEEDGYRPTAGLELIRALRGKGYEGPIFVYTNSRGIARRQEVISAGGNGITVSLSELLSLLRTIGEFPGPGDP